jgi:hypothetical protein
MIGFFMCMQEEYDLPIWLGLLRGEVGSIR